MAIFDNKNFNAQVFGQYIDRIPNLTRNRMIKSGAIRMRNDLATALKDDVGGNFLSTPLLGLVNGDPVNYDGNTNITADSTKTFSHSRVVVGRAKAWTEKDFSYDITGGVDFMENVAQQVAEYWDEIDQNTLVSILKGVFSMSDAKGQEFIASHTYDVTAKTNTEGVVGNMDGTTLNTAMQRACGDHKSRFSLAIMHSMVATNLENLKLLVYLKYNDAEGLQRDLTIGTLNGRLVLVDDSMPTAEDESTATYEKTSDEAVVEGKTYYTRSGSSGNYTYTKVDNPSTSSIGSYYEKTAAGDTIYTTFVFGDGAIEFTNCGAKVPYAMARDEKTNGGQDTLYTRQRKCFAPYGISFTKSVMVSNSPTDAELENGANWELVNTNDGVNKEYISLKAIPIARIISKG